MTIDTVERLASTAGSEELIIEAVDASVVAPPLEYGARGAFVVAAISVALLFIGWLAFYFLLFIPRGSIG
jgi:hypothetical protein